MVTNDQRSPYGVYVAKKRTILQSPYGGRKDPTIKKSSRHRTVTGEVMYYLKFHGARMAFCRVTDGKLTSAGHRTVDLL